MSKIASFVHLDFYTLKPYKKSIILLIVIGLILGLTLKSLSVLPAIFMMWLVMYMSYPFSIAEKNGMDTLYATLPLRRRDIVIGRFAFVLLMEFITIAFVLLLSLLLSNLFPLPMEQSMGEALFSLCVLSAVFSLLVAIQYPLYFKLGYTKAKLFTYIPFLLILMLIGFWSAEEFSIAVNWIAVWHVISANPFLMYGSPVTIGLILIGISCALSCRLYERRDI